MRNCGHTLLSSLSLGRSLLLIPYLLSAVVSQALPLCTGCWRASINSTHRNDSRAFIGSSSRHRMLSWQRPAAAAAAERRQRRAARWLVGALLASSTRVFIACFARRNFHPPASGNCGLCKHTFWSVQVGLQTHWHHLQPLHRPHIITLHDSDQIR